MGCSEASIMSTVVRRTDGHASRFPKGVDAQSCRRKRSAMGIETVDPTSAPRASYSVMPCLAKYPLRRAPRLAVP